MMSPLTADSGILERLRRFSLEQAVRIGKNADGEPGITFRRAWHRQAV